MGILRTAAHRPLPAALVVGLVTASAVAVSAAAASSAPLIRPAALATSALTAPASPRIIYGDSVTLSTTLTDATTQAPLVDQTVTLVGHTAHSPGFVVMATEQTDANGAAKATVTPKANTFYRWSFAGSEGHRKANSAIGQVLVGQVVEASLTHPTVKHRHATRIWGTVAPGEIGTPVDFERHIHGKWKALNITSTRVKVQTLPNHKREAGFVAAYTPTKAGKETLRVEVDASPTYGGGFSSHLALTVR
jgi:hypothetical protein